MALQHPASTSSNPFDLSRRQKSAMSMLLEAEFKRRWLEAEVRETQAKRRFANHAARRSAQQQLPALKSASSARLRAERAALVAVQEATEAEKILMEQVAGAKAAEKIAAAIAADDERGRLAAAAAVIAAHEEAGIAGESHAMHMPAASMPEAENITPHAPEPMPKQLQEAVEPETSGVSLPHAAQFDSASEEILTAEPENNAREVAAPSANAVTAAAPIETVATVPAAQAIEQEAHGAAPRQQAHFTVNDGLIGGDTLLLSDTKLGEGATGSVWLGTLLPPPRVVSLKLSASDGSLPAVLGRLTATPHAAGSEVDMARPPLQVAVKVVSKQELSAEELMWVRQEIEIHRKMHHPHICPLLGVIEDSQRLGLVLSLCAGRCFTDTLKRCASAKARLDEALVRQYFLQLLSAVRYCHARGVSHHDLYLDNLCWADTQETTLQLIDFGFATDEVESDSFAGTAHYAAPEVHLASDGEIDSYVCLGADVWSLGVCLFSMLECSLPFEGDEETDEAAAALKAKIMAGRWDSEPRCSAQARSLLEGMLTVEPGERLSIEQVVSSPWVGRGVALAEVERNARERAPALLAIDRH